MQQTNLDHALAEMDVAQDEMAIYATLLSRAQLSLVTSFQAFEQAQIISASAECSVSKQLTENLRQQYAALVNLTAKIVETINNPTLSKVIATAPKNSPQLPTLLKCLPEAESNLIITVLTGLLQGKELLLSVEQVDLAASIVCATWK